MDDTEHEEILYRLDERTKRVDEHLNRLDERLSEVESEMRVHDDKIQENENNISMMMKAGGGTVGFIMTTTSAVLAKMAGIIKI